MKNQFFYLVAWLFLSGTIIQELSHFCIAIILFLPMKEIRIFPQIENQSIKLEMVYYIKKDFLRGLLVRIAPLFGAILFFLTISHLCLNLLLYYLIFNVSTIMFSSKKDLEDLLSFNPIFVVYLSYRFSF